MRTIPCNFTPEAAEQAVTVSRACHKHALRLDSGELCFLCAAEERMREKCAVRAGQRRQMAFRQLNQGDRE